MLKNLKQVKAGFINLVETISLYCFITYRWGDSTNLQHDGNVLFSLPYMRLVEFHPCQAAYAISNIKTTCYLARKNAELYLAHLPLISTLIDIIYILLLLSHSTVFCYFWDQDFPLSLKYVIRWFTSILKESGKNIS